MKVHVVAFCAAALLAAPAIAQPSRTAPAPSSSGSGSGSGSGTGTASTTAQGDHAADGQHLICRRSEGDPSSRMGVRRVCHTAEEWRAIQRSAE